MTKIFISYSSQDRPFAEALAQRLKEREIVVWYDQWEMRVGDSLTAKIQKGITESSFLAVVLSPDSVQSKWVTVELQTAMSREIETGNVFVLPILYRDCQLPAFLTDKVYADFRSDFSRGFQYLLLSLASSSSHFTEDGLLDRLTHAIIIEKLNRMNTSEIATLVSLLEERWGVSASKDTDTKPSVALQSPPPTTPPKRWWRFWS